MPGSLKGKYVKGTINAPDLFGFWHIDLKWAVDLVERPVMDAMMSPPVPWRLQADIRLAMDVMPQRGWMSIAANPPILES